MLTALKFDPDYSLAPPYYYLFVRDGGVDHENSPTHLHLALLVEASTAIHAKHAAFHYRHQPRGVSSSDFSVALDELLSSQLNLIAVHKDVRVDRA